MNKGEEAKTKAVFTMQGEFRCVLLWNNMLFLQSDVTHSNTEGGVERDNMWRASDSCLVKGAS